MSRIQYSDEMLYYVFKYVFPAAFALLPGRMNTGAARAMLLAIMLQESRAMHRKQIGGPAHGLWQFERGGGVVGVLTHDSTRLLVAPVLETLRYKADSRECYTAIVHNDVLACVFARLLLWTVSGALPSVSEPDKGWDQYISGWRPGKPHRETWNECFSIAWKTVITE